MYQRVHLLSDVMRRMQGAMALSSLVYDKTLHQSQRLHDFNLFRVLCTKCSHFVGVNVSELGYKRVLFRYQVDREGFGSTFA